MDNTSKPIVLALDIATTTGWCVEASERQWGHALLKKPKETHYDRLYNFWNFLTFLYRKYKFTHLVCERPMGKGIAKEVLTEMKGVVSLFAATKCLEITFVSATTLKKYATGNGKAKKPEMIQAAQEKGYVGESDDEADAYHLLCYYLEKICNL